MERIAIATHILNMEVGKQIAYWRDGSLEDFAVGEGLVRQGKIRHGMFFVHLAIEKILKASVCRQTKDFAPRIHSLLRLAELTGLNVSPTRLEFLARFDQYNIAGRYPGTLTPLPSQTETERDMRMANEVFKWLTEQL